MDVFKRTVVLVYDATLYSKAEPYDYQREPSYLALSFALNDWCFFQASVRTHSLSQPFLYFIAGSVFLKISRVVLLPPLSAPRRPSLPHEA